MLIEIKKEYDVEDLVNELEKRVDYAEEYEKFNVLVPITVTKDILDVLHELLAGVKNIKEV